MKAGILMQMPTQTSDGMGRLTGHSLRVTGAQGLSRMGVDAFAVQLLGRWGSATVMAYIREASVGSAAAQARGRFLAKNLEELTSAAAESGLLEPNFDLTPDKVKQWIAEWLPAAIAMNRATLAEEVANYLGRARARQVAPEVAPPASTSSSSSSSSSSSAPATAPRDPDVSDPAAVDPAGTGLAVTVANRTTRRNHRIAIGPPSLETEIWTTWCGWMWGRYGTASHTSPHYRNCRICFPADRC